MPRRARHPRLLALGCLALAMALVACSGAADGEGDPAAASAASATATGAQAAAGSAAAGGAAPSGSAATASAKPATLLDRALVTAVFDTWLAAQNGGDFDTYASTYATRFTGVKRSGPRIRQFDRAGWLADRNRMFGKKMQVTADDLQVDVSATSATVSFVQTWASGSYRDVGPKQLVVVREASGLKIAREEMLRSQLLGQEAPAVPPATTFSLLGNTGRLQVVLSAEPGDELGTGAPRLLDGKRDGTAERDVDPAQLSEEQRAWSGRAVALHGAAGVVCEARVSGFLLTTRYTPHFGEIQSWTEGWEGDGSDVPNDAQVAQTVWSGGSAGRVLVAQLGPPASGSCEGALWANAGGADETRTVHFPPAPELVNALRGPALAALRNLPGFKTIQGEYKALGGTGESEPAASWDRDADANVQVQVFQDSKGLDAIVAVSVTTGVGCGGFWGEFWAVWQASELTAAAPTLTLLSDGKEPGESFVLRAVADVEGDGTIELISDDRLLKSAGGVLREAVVVRVPYFDCPC